MELVSVNEWLVRFIWLVVWNQSTLSLAHKFLTWLIKILNFWSFRGSIWSLFIVPLYTQAFSLRHCDYRLIQEEKKTTEQRAEELESQAVSGGLDTMMTHRWQTDQPYEKSSPPMSGRSTPSPRPSLQSRDYVQKYHTLNSSVSYIMWLSCLNLMWNNAMCRCYFKMVSLQPADSQVVI